MDIVKIETEGNVKYTTNEKGFNLWCEHYNTYLKDLFNIFKETKGDKINWLNIDYNIFCYILYRNSSKYLSPYI